MGKPKTQSEIDTQTLEGLLEDLREVQRRLDAQLVKLDSAERLSEAYHDALAEIYTLMTWLESLAPDIQTEISRLDDQSPDD